MTVKDLVQRACVEKAILDLLKGAHEVTRAEIRAELDAGDRKSADAGKAWVSEPKPRWKVTDEAALLEYVECNMPDQLVYQVNPTFRAQLVSSGGVLDGVQVPGIEQVQGSPTLTVKPGDSAHNIASQLLASTVPTAEVEQ